MNLFDYCIEHGIDFMLYHETLVSISFLMFIKDSKVLRIDYSRDEFLNISHNSTIEEQIIKRLKKEFPDA